MVSSRIFRANHPSRVPVLLQSPAGRPSGLLSASLVMTDHLATILENAVSRVIGSLPMAEVNPALCHTLGLWRDSTVAPQPPNDSPTSGSRKARSFPRPRRARKAHA